MRTRVARRAKLVEATVGDKRDVSCRQAPAKLGAVTIAKCVVHDGCRQAWFLNLDKGSSQSAGDDCHRSSVFEGIFYIQSNKRFILDDEDDASD